MPTSDFDKNFVTKNLLPCNILTLSMLQGKKNMLGCIRDSVVLSCSVFVNEKRQVVDVKKDGRILQGLLSFPLIHLHIGNFQVPWRSRPMMTRLKVIQSPTASKGSQKILKFLGSKVQKLPDTKNPRFQGSKTPRFQGSKVPRFQGSKAPMFQDSKVPRLLGSKVPRF